MPLRWPEPPMGECSQAGCELCAAVPIAATASPLGKGVLSPWPRDGALSSVPFASEEPREQPPLLSSSRLVRRALAKDEPATCVVPAKPL